ncbi:MAG: lipid II flippase MurJ [Actinomycetes bacterium]
MGGTAAAPEAVAARNRAAARMSALTVVSRLTGFARVVVVAAVLGATYLGNVYQSANSVPNILFELFAAGVLQSVLVPVMVEAVDQHGGDGAERTAGVVLGAVGAVLAAVVAAGMVAAPLVMRLLVSGVDDPAVRAAQVELGTFLLWFFLPQVIFYAANLVATATLNAKGIFGLPVFAPTVNNVVVIASYLLFGWMRRGAAPSLVLTLPQKLVLALGTTLGVVAFCAVPVVGLARTGTRLRPRWAPRDPVLRRLARQGLWAAGFLAATQVLLVVVLYLSNAVEGGVVIYQLAFVLFMLPNSLFAVPVLTTAFPALARHYRAGGWQDFADEVGRATRAIVWFTTLSAGALVALAGPLSYLVAYGNATGRNDELAGAIAGFALGLPAFSLVLFLVRVAYAFGDTRSPALVALAMVVAGGASMVVLSVMGSATDRIALVGAGYAVGQTAGLVGLGLVVRHRLRHEGVRVPHLFLPAVRSTGAAALASVVVGVAVARVAPTTRGAAALTVVLGGAAILGGGVALGWASGGPGPRALAATLGAHPGRRVEDRAAAERLTEELEREAGQ